MGQQQLLLIVLGVIIVGVAVVGGISLFGTSRDSGIKDELVSQCIAIGSNAQQFFMKPSSMGGGENTFNTGGLGNGGYDIPTSMRSTTNGNYVKESSTPTTCTITATPKVISGVTYSFAKVTAVVTPTTITTSVE
jgi:hypothetical protein